MEASTRSSAATEPTERWLVDGYNVLRVSLTDRDSSAAADAWWSAPRREALIELARCLPARHPTEVLIVFDGRRQAQADPDPHEARRASPEPPPGAPAPRRPLVRSVFAPSADEWIVRELKTRGARGAPVTRVVTADRKLASRSRHHGAEIVSTGKFVELCTSSGS